MLASSPAKFCCAYVVFARASRLLTKSASGVLATLKGSTYGGEYDSPLRLLRPCWTAFLNSLRAIRVPSVTVNEASFLGRHMVCQQPASRSMHNQYGRPPTASPRPGGPILVDLLELESSILTVLRLQIVLYEPRRFRDLPLCSTEHSRADSAPLNDDKGHAAGACDLLTAQFGKAIETGQPTSPTRRGHV